MMITTKMSTAWCAAFASLLALTGCAGDGADCKGEESCDDEANPELGRKKSDDEDEQKAAADDELFVAITVETPYWDYGSVSVWSDGGFCLGDTCTVLAGSVVTIEAFPASDWQFTRWNGCGDSRDKRVSFTATYSETCRAGFSPYFGSDAGPRWGSDAGSP